MEFQLNTFKMVVMNIERTFVDKLFAIADYYLFNESHRHSRHIYDLHKIWKSDLFSIKIAKDIINNVIIDRQVHLERNISCTPGQNVTKVVERIINEDFYKEDFNNLTTTFIHEKISYTECLLSIEEILKANILPLKIPDYDNATKM